MCRGPRAGSRGVAQRRGKNPDTMVSGGPVPSIGPTPEQGIGRAMHSSGPHSANSDRQRKEGRARYEVRSTRFTDADMEIVPDGSGSTDEWPAACVDVGEIGAAWQRTSRDTRHVLCSLSLAAPEFGSRKLYANLGRAAGQDDDNVFAVLWTNDRQPRTMSLVCAARVRALPSRR